MSGGGGSIKQGFLEEVAYDLRLDGDLDIRKVKYGEGVGRVHSVPGIRNSFYKSSKAQRGLKLIVWLKSHVQGDGRLRDEAGKVR